MTRQTFAIASLFAGLIVGLSGCSPSKPLPPKEKTPWVLTQEERKRIADANVNPALVQYILSPKRVRFPGIAASTKL